MSTLNQSDLDQFDEFGYVVVPGLLDIERDIQPVIEEYEQLLDNLIGQWQSEGHLSSAYTDLPFGPRLIRAVTESRQRYDLVFDISLPQSNITEDTPMHHGPATFGLLRSPRLLDAVESIVGPEIYSCPVQHTRIKLPEHLLPDSARTGLTGRIAWHQDLGVIDSEADKADILTVWFPITDATEENGCLGVIPGTHKRELAVHCRSSSALVANQVCIPDALIQGEQVAVPMQPGDVLLMHRKTQHSGLPNRSDRIRWSFDLRYEPIGQPTGRPWFPGFVVRSQAQPDTELHDWKLWEKSWCEARNRLAHNGNRKFNRWSNDSPYCA